MSRMGRNAAVSADTLSTNLIVPQKHTWSPLEAKTEEIFGPCDVILDRDGGIPVASGYQDGEKIQGGAELL